MTDATRPKVLITGGAGFIGFHLARRLLAKGWLVTGVDGITPYYDVALKHRRLDVLKGTNAFNFREFMLEDMDAVRGAFEEAQPDVVIHLAAQAGVRYSLEHPRSYVDSNVVGTFNVMEMVRELRPRHFLLASTSSIYGANTEMPFAETHRADHPVTIYAATKKATEMMAHSYAHLHELPTTAFRFFTVYGPWGRPDMTPFKFVDLVMAGKPIDVYGEGDMRRDFTFIDDLVEGVARLIDAVPVVGEPVEGVADSLAPTAPFRVVNVGGGKPAGLMEFIDCLEKHLGQPIQRNMLPMQQGDVRETFASADLLEALTGYRPATSVDEGIKAFVDWYQIEYLPGRA